MFKFRDKSIVEAEKLASVEHTPMPDTRATYEATSSSGAVWRLDARQAATSAGVTYTPPKPGDYVVLDADNRQTWLTAVEFEARYAPLETGPFIP